MRSSLVFLAIAQFVVSFQALGQVLSDSDFAVGKVSINDWVDSTSLSAILGNPVRVTRFTDDHQYATPVTFITFDFDSVTICIGENGIQSIETISTSMLTRRGVRVGDTVEKVKALYGLPTNPSWSDCDGLCYFLHNSALGIDFETTDGRVVKIFVGYWAL